MYRLMTALIMFGGLLAAPSAMATPLTVGSSDNVQRVLESQKGNRVTVKLASGDELTGTVKTVTSQVVHIGQLSGKEFYDAVVEIGRISAIIIRTK